MVYRRPLEAKKVSACEYLPCEFCHGFFHENQLWAHCKGCYGRIIGVDTPHNYVKNGRLMLSPFMMKDQKTIDELDMVLDKMKETGKNPGIKEICCRDELIREFGHSLLAKLGTLAEQRRKDQDNLRTKMRSVGRLLKKLNDQKLTDQPLDSYITQKEFMNVVSMVKALSREADSPQLAITVGHYLKQIALLKASIALQREDARKKKEANDFQELYAAHWNSRVSSVACRTQRLRCINKTIDIPSTEDLVTMKEYLVKETTAGLKNTKPTYAEYVKMTQKVTARIVLFNKRRIAEVDELKVADFRKRIKGDVVGSNREIIESLGISEKALLMR